MTTNTYITIKALKVLARHGVFPVERVVGNDFLVDAVLYYDAQKAMSEDDISCALNYAEAVSVINAAMEKPSRLLENVVGRIIADLTEKFPAITRGSVTVTKVTPPIPSQMAGISFTAEFSL